jgi:hypothetical protein
MPSAYRRGRADAVQPPEGVVLQKPAARKMTGSYGSPDEEFLFGPTRRPGEPVSTGATSAQAPPPADVGLWLPKLLEAAADPSAPPELLELVKVLRERMQGA